MYNNLDCQYRKRARTRPALYHDLKNCERFTWLGEWMKFQAVYISYDFYKKMLLSSYKNRARKLLH